MTFAYDDWVLFPVLDLYDKDIMKMAILTAKDMYDKGEEKLDKFYKEFGDFTSPFAKDMARYGELIGGVRDMINDAYANGVDLLRSPEGRAMISQAINRINPVEINMLRQSAEAGREYIKNRGILEASGKYNKDLEENFLGYNMNDWDTSKNGIWNRTAPVEFKTLKELTEPWYNQRTPHTLDKAGVESFGLKYDPRYDYTGFTNLDLLNIASGLTPGWNDSIYSDYYRQLAKNKLINAGVESPTSKDIEAQLLKDIATANTEYLISPTLSVNPLYLQQLKNSLARAIAGMRRGNNGDQNNPYNAPTTFMDRLQRNIDVNFENKNFGRGGIRETFNGIVDYWDKMAKSHESKGKVVGSEKYTEKQNRLEGSFVPGMSSYANSAYGIKDVLKDKPVYNQKENSLYNKAVYEKSRWANIANGNYYPSRYDTRKTEDGKYIVQVINGILRKGANATPQEMKLLSDYYQEDVLKMMMKSKSSSPEWSTLEGRRGLMYVSLAKKLASNFWDSFSAEGLGATQNKVLHQQFVGASSTIKDPDLPNGYYSVRFGSGYHYAPVRQLSISGNALFKHNDIHNKFDRFLNGQTGISINENDVKAAGIPHMDRVGRSLDILSHPLITKDQLSTFYDGLGESDKRKYKDIDAVAKQLGLRPVNQKITYKDKDDELHETDTYYEVPVIRTIENLGGYNFRDINVLSDNIEFNAGTADKNVINSENLSVTEDLPIELAIQMLQ